MASAAAVRRMFIIFHVVLGLTLLIGGAMTAAIPGHGAVHVRLIGGVEAVGAVLFLVPRTLRLGAVLLLVAMGIALLLHMSWGEWRWDLLVYAAGVAYVALHGAAYR